jgi:hypothetical protein
MLSVPRVPPQIVVLVMRVTLVRPEANWVGAGLNSGGNVRVLPGIGKGAGI